MAGEGRGGVRNCQIETQRGNWRSDASPRTVVGPRGREGGVGLAGDVGGALADKSAISSR